MKIYQVGGAVRDYLLGKAPHDIDYAVVGATPEKMLEHGFIQVGKSFPVFLHPTTKEEYALARKEVKTGPKHTDFKFDFSADITLEEDLERRDFTCNALARDLETGEIIDICGGKADIKNKILRHINSEHFIEDPLRVLRMCRFAAQLNFAIAPETMALAQKMVDNGMLKSLSAERFREEFCKALECEHFARFIAESEQCGALKYLLLHTSDVLEKARDEFYSFMQMAEKGNTLIKFAALFWLCDDAQKIKSDCQKIKMPLRFTEFAVALNKYGHHFAANEPDDGYLFDMLSKISRFKSFEEAEMLFKALETLNIPAEKTKERSKLIFEIASAIKTSEIPGFESLPKNESLKEKYREFILLKAAAEP